jgi:hypothetical protein
MKIYVFHDLKSEKAPTITEDIEIDSQGPKLGGDLYFQPFYRFFGHLYWTEIENYYSIANYIEINKELGLTTYNVNGL